MSSRFTSRRRPSDRPNARAPAWDRIRAAQTAVVADVEPQPVAFARIAHRAPTLGTVAAIAIIVHTVTLLVRPPLVNREHMPTTDTPVRCEVKRDLLDAYDTETAAFAASVSLLHQKLGTSSKEQYEVLQRAVEVARVRSEQARVALETHTLQHGC